MTTFLTGASGFVGAAVLRALLAEQHDVRVLVRPESDRRNLEGLSVDVATGDLRDPRSLERALGGCDTVFHVAADYRLWVPRPEAIYAANVEGTRHLMRAAGERGARRIVYTSSVATLGVFADGRVADEATPSTLDDMIGHYKRSKFLAEAEVSRLVRDANLPVVIVNPSTPIGPRDVKPTPTGRMIVEAATGRMPAFVDTGLNLVHVDDVARGHLLALARGRVGERYILGGVNASLMEILADIAAIVGRRPPRIRLPHDAVMPIAHFAEAWARIAGGEPFVTKDSVRMARKRMYFSSAKAERELGYAVRPVEEALRDAIAWFRDHGYLS
ncbi:MAG: NAD-dependent epimerase/dehydratase family protein [Alphaproteobacteria bacterium]